MTPRIHLWLYRGLYVLVALISIAIPLLPLGFSASRLAMPDLFFIVTVLWITRESNSAPLIIVALLALLADAVLMRPLGLWAVLIILATELVRLNDRMLREGGFLAEIVFMAVLMIAMVAIQNILLFLTLSGTYPLSKLAQFVLLSMVCYPFVALFLHYVLRVRSVAKKRLPDRLGRVG